MLLLPATRRPPPSSRHAPPPAACNRASPTPALLSPPPQLLEEVKALGERRFALVSGKAAPTSEELAGLDAAAAAAAAGAARGVPYFWASVLRNCDAVSESLSRRDALCLEHLVDVKRVGKGEARGVELVFDTKVGGAWRGRVLEAGGAAEGSLQPVHARAGMAAAPAWQRGSSKRNLCMRPAAAL